MPWICSPKRLSIYQQVEKDINRIRKWGFEFLLRYTFCSHLLYYRVLKLCLACFLSDGSMFSDVFLETFFLVRPSTFPKILIIVFLGRTDRTKFKNRFSMCVFHVGRNSEANCHFLGSCNCIFLFILMQSSSHRNRSTHFSFLFSLLYLQLLLFCYYNIF